MVLFRLRELMGRWEVDNRQRLSFDDLGRRVGVSPQVLSRMADPVGDYATSTRHVDALCNFFKVTPNDLLAVFPDDEQLPANS